MAVADPRTCACWRAKSRSCSAARSPSGSSRPGGRVRFNVDRSWVYAHANELGVIRLGNGPRPRLRFDSAVVARCLLPSPRRSRADERSPRGTATHVPLLPIKLDAHAAYSRLLGGPGCHPSRQARSSSATGQADASSPCGSAHTAGATSSRSAAASDGWTRAKAEAELRYVLADVERGLWAPEVAAAAEAPLAPTFHEFASEWLEARRPELRASSIADYTWQLCNHLLPFFHRHRLPQITVAEVDRYREFKVREGALSAESINKTITRLGQILAVAEERDLVARNPVRVNTRNRKLKTKRRRPGLPRLGRADRRDDRGGGQPRRGPRRADRRPPRADRDAGLRRAADRRGDGADLGRHRPGQRPHQRPRRQDRSGRASGRHPACAPRRAHDPPARRRPSSAQRLSSSPPRAAAAATRTTRASA